MKNIKNIAIALGFQHPSMYMPLWNYDFIEEYEIITDSKILLDIQAGIQQDVEQHKNRLNIISPYVEFNRTFLDLGCNTGWNTFEIYDRGGSVTGVDRNPINNALSENLIEHHHLDKDRIGFVCGEVFDYLEVCEKYDYCICFLVIHHHFRESTENDMFVVNQNKTFTDEAVNILNNIKNKSHVSFIQTRFDGDGDMEITADQLAFKNYLIDIIGFKEVDILPYTKEKYWGNGHPIYYCES